MQARQEHSLVNGSRGREWREPWLPKWVRRTDKSPRRFQVRVYVGPKNVYPVNFGSYPSESEAGRVAKKIRIAMAKGEDIWSILTSLIISGDVSPMVTARYVFKVSSGWAVKARRRGVVVNLDGPFGSPSEARLAAREALA